MLHHLISIFCVKKNKTVTAIIEDILKYQNLQKNSQKVWKSLRLYRWPRRPAFLLKVSCSLLVVIFLSSPFYLRTHYTRSVLLSVQSAARGHRGSTSVAQVVTQMMTNWLPFCSPPNQVQTWLSSPRRSRGWRSMALRWNSCLVQSHRVKAVAEYKLRLSGFHWCILMSSDDYSGHCLHYFELLESNFTKLYRPQTWHLNLPPQRLACFHGDKLQVNQCCCSNVVFMVDAGWNFLILRRCSWWRMFFLPVNMKYEVKYVLLMQLFYLTLRSICIPVTAS